RSNRYQTARSGHLRIALVPEHAAVRSEPDGSVWLGGHARCSRARGVSLVKSIIVFSLGMVLASAVSALAQTTTTSTSLATSTSTVPTTSTSLTTSTSTVTTTSTSHTTSTSTSTSTLPPKNELKCASPNADPCVISGSPTVSVPTATLNVWPRSIRI